MGQTMTTGPFGAAAARILKGNAPESDIAACGAALAYFCLQVPFLSLNGVCEACAHARADARALSLLSGVHVACCVEIKILRRVRPPRHRRDACSMAWWCSFPPLGAIAEK